MNKFLRAGWIVAVGAIPALLSAIFGHPTWHSMLRQAAFGSVYSSCIGGLCSYVLPKIAATVLRLHPALKWISLVSIIVVLAAAGCFAATVILTASGVSAVQDFVPEFTSSLKLSILITLVFGIAAFSQEVFVAQLGHARKTAEQLRQAATEARLSSLESRVQPHFLFNTLNSVLTLIREDPPAAERMVERLAALLRFSLDANQSRLVPLSLEAKIIRDYLEIEQARFGSRLRYSIDIPASLEALQVPPMCLQTVVENSVKYAVSSRREGATITMKGTVSGNTARIQVLDDGPGFPPSSLKPGHGLELLQSRIAGLYGASGSVEIGNLPQGGASVTVAVPAF